VFSDVLQTWVPSRHLMLRIEAASVAYHQELVPYLVVTGGHNIGIRYDKENIFERPNFAFEAFTRAQDFPSEASIMKQILHVVYRVPREHVFQESLSATTTENSKFLEILFQRTPTFDGLKKIALITQLYHMPVALKAFPVEGVEPLFVEDLLREDPRDVVEYYEDRYKRTQNPFPDIAQLTKLMHEKRSVAELMPNS
jgi:uncharacterized SAM-binding protein YcdF (DUF218 family)